MGQSTDAYLFYGYAWSEEHRLFGDPDYDEDEDEFDREWTASESGKEEFGVEINSHCSGDYPIPLIHISESMTRAWRGDPKEVDVAAIATAPLDEWNARLAAFVEKHGISLESTDKYDPAPKGPGWFIASYWG